MTLADFVLQARREERGFPAPVPQVFVFDTGKQRMIGHPFEDPSQTVLRDPKAEPLLQNLRCLFEQHDLETVARDYCCAFLNGFEHARG